MTKNCIIINDIHDITGDNLKQFQNDNYVIVSLDFKSHKQLSTLNINHNTFIDYLTSEEKDFISKTALDIATRWYKHDKIQDYLVVDNINFGWLLENEFFFHLLIIIANFYAFLKIKEKEKPKVVIVSKDFFEMAKIVFKDSEIKTMGENNMEKQQFPFDVFSVKYNIGSIPITLRIPRKYFFLMREYYEKTLVPLFNALFTKLDKSRKSILLVDFNPTQYHDLLKSLVQKNRNILLLNRRRVALYSFKAFNVVRKSGCIPVSYEKFLNTNDKKEIKEKILSMNNNLDLLLREQEVLSDLFSIRDDSFWNHINKYFKKYCMNRFEEAIYEMVGARVLLTNTHPSVILHFYEIALQEKVLIQQARKINIPTILVQHGTPFLQFPNLDLFNPVTGFIPLYHDKKMIVWGKLMKEFLLRNGVKEENIIMTGNPKTDVYFRLRKKIQHKEKGTIFVGLGQLGSINLNTQSIDTYEKYEKALKIICETLKTISDRKKIVKLHPGEMHFRTVVVEPIIHSIDPSIQIIVEADLGELLKSADVVITIGISTILMEANIFEIPTMTIIADDQEWPGISSSGYSKYFTPNEGPQFKNYLNDLLTNNKIRGEHVRNGIEFVNAYLVNHGHASENFADIVSRY